MAFKYSIIVPIYNRISDIRELLQSIATQTRPPNYEVIIIDDGSEPPCRDAVIDFKNQLPLQYFYKKNTGPGGSRNYGVNKATGKYVIFVDSDCILPNDYLSAVNEFVERLEPACFGGRDTATKDFTFFQKAVNHAMTSFLSTGGIRGSRLQTERYEPRSFNMGIRKDIFIQLGGFRNLHPGEDPDLAIRIRKLGYACHYAESVYVYHSRRIGWHSFALQMYKFGMARTLLHYWHLDNRRLTHWFPFIFCLGLLIAIPLVSIFPWLLLGYLLYFLAIFLEACILYKSILVAILSLATVTCQFFCYGYGFIKGKYRLLCYRYPRKALPSLFFGNH